MGYVSEARLSYLVPHESKFGAHSVKSVLKIKALALQCFLGFFNMPYAQDRTKIYSSEIKSISDSSNLPV